ncbi:hypothetical protein A3I27_01500 [Candidatus Giovannonibacteria bacterium RIFCSPLOWO2_02_FULL_43_11b]|uniref:Response regulatory domain-containing protein n=1 Tax=Candidatus Taylorbacteria bacterium RIFCSPHIGHO2_12_FULL_45_16 TaxID=1802315 RepID=A0A1G2MY98_9BACT|nr:MAG: hypothetical protein A3B97_01290 [Candidatus Giovannonibacteria bacterium RIFCSPHIGHO2_02_FULL_43_32]OGF78798.1 MAG: hypothetical protein A3A15_02315 [Candidatus Giovannonibacteria bacterium RIFCSPLOWO2_01_FULL_43_60]OGF89429.1 MAG: hypothetical protein A3I27_01500 [Candidatus Giovannonibacteria bacterium RIFCSPLOWO2_02_FULL_43_11b]OGF92379.1 MAG: hypothetical protein A3H04_01455 [Candidatus Giovannonibacteria bacterium RIFCSPLOWO2_12_FULL_43_11c]OHA16372.1 MAG: hypothetical protein A28
MNILLIESDEKLLDIYAGMLGSMAEISTLGLTEFQIRTDSGKLEKTLQEFKPDLVIMSIKNLAKAFVTIIEHRRCYFQRFPIWVLSGFKTSELHEQFRSADLILNKGEHCSAEVIQALVKIQLSYARARK